MVCHEREWGQILFKLETEKSVHDVDIQQYSVWYMQMSTDIHMIYVLVTSDKFCTNMQISSEIPMIYSLVKSDYYGPSINIFDNCSFTWQYHDGC